MAEKIDDLMVEAVQVQFLKPIFEDDFPEKGMKAWLTDVEWDTSTSCYKLYFDFTDFEAENLKYFKETYWPNNKTGTDKSFYTAIEAGYYTPKYSVLLSLTDSTNGHAVDERDDLRFKMEVLDYIRIIDKRDRAWFMIL